MFSPATLSIIGAVTGIVGAITGLAGLVLGWINHRRVQQIKALDLRLELRKQVSDVRAVVAALPDLLERSQASRSAVLAAIGLSQSGAFESWKAAWESDLKAARALASEVPDAAETYKRLRQQNLETKLVEVHAVATKAAALRDKYLTALASDDKEREHIRADARVLFNADRRAGLYGRRIASGTAAPFPPTDVKFPRGLRGALQRQCLALMTFPRCLRVYSLLCLKSDDPARYESEILVGNRYTAHWDEPDIQQLS